MIGFKIDWSQEKKNMSYNLKGFFMFFNKSSISAIYCARNSH